MQITGYLRVGCIEINFRLWGLSEAPVAPAHFNVSVNSGLGCGLMVADRCAPPDFWLARFLAPQFEVAEFESAPPIPWRRY